MVKKVLLGAAFCVPFMFGNADLQASATGGFVYVSGGYGYSKVKEAARPKDKKASDQVDLFELEKKNGFVLEVGGGYGQQIGSFYVGAEVRVASDVTKFDQDKSKGEFSKSLVNGADTEIANGIFAVTEGRIACTYGASVFAGVKVAQNIVFGAGIGIEGQYTTISQYVIGVPGFVMQNDAGQGISYEHSWPDGDKTVKTLTLKGNGSEKLKVNLLNIVPSIFVNYYFTENFFVGGKVDFAIGINKKVDEKYYNSDANISVTHTDGTTDDTVVISSLSKAGQTLHMKSPFGIRVGLRVGYKF